MNPSFLRTGRALAALLLGVVFTAIAALAQNNTTGSIYGRAAAGSNVTVEHLGMGFKRTAAVGTDGAYRIVALPPGTYEVTFTTAQGAARTQTVEVGIGSGTQVEADDVVRMDKFTVGALSINPVDFSNTTSVSLYTDKQLDQLPVGRSTTEIALLSPGTVQGDSTFPFPSFGGASVAENAYFINGFNITSFYRGLGGATIPFEFYNQFEVNTGAYSAEFGRSTGGVINATSKRGSNQFHFAANVYYEPDAGRANRPNVYYANNAGTIVPSAFFSKRYSESSDANVAVSGPLWKNRLFVYGLYQWRQRMDKDTNGTTRFDRWNSSDPFMALKVDFLPFKDHHLEYTGLDASSRSTTTQWNYDFANQQIITTVAPGISYSDSGGKTHIGRYTGTFFDRLTLSALVGRGQSNRTTHSSLDHVSRVDDARTGATIRLAGGPTLQVTDAVDTRKAVRFDAEYAFNLAGSHRLRAGYDQEHNLSDERSQYGGGAFYRYETVTPGQALQGGTVPAGVTQVVRRQIFRSGGAFTVDSDAWYVEDTWTTLKNRLVVRAGLRSESFVNRDKNKIPFISIDNQMAPRLGAAYDLFGDQKTKVFANYGRYHLPIATNVNSGQAGAQYLATEWFALSSVGADFQPTLGAKIGDTALTQPGIVRDQREITDQDIKPMSQDEWVLGVQHRLSRQFKVGLRGIARDFGYAIDDMIVNHALVAWARANGYPTYTYSGPGTRAYVLGNAGRPITMYWDFNKNGTTEANEKATLTAEMLGYPAAERKYYAVEFTAERLVDEKWGAQFSYTWAHSYGNYEGLVHSDSNQSSTGLTRLFDSPGLTRNTFGDLPNDKRHQFKLLGTYLPTKEITLGLNLQLLSGRARNRLGIFNDPLPLNATTILGTQYGPYYLLEPRGSVGRTPWQFRQALTVTYRPKWVAKGRLTMSATVYNLLNRLTPMERIEYAQTSTGAADLTYGLPNSWMSPRSVRLSARFEY
jgi:hypothetical protein